MSDDDYHARLGAMRSRYRFAPVFEKSSLLEEASNQGRAEALELTRRQPSKDAITNLCSHDS
jgi:hypothetical protein